jgi:hypothetical protein
MLCHVVAKLYDKIMNGEYEIPSFVSQGTVCLLSFSFCDHSLMGMHALPRIGGRDLISKLLNTTPTKRYTAEQVREHAWYKSVNVASDPVMLPPTDYPSGTSPPQSPRASASVNNGNSRWTDDNANRNNDSKSSTSAGGLLGSSTFLLSERRSTIVDDTSGGIDHEVIRHMTMIGYNPVHVTDSITNGKHDHFAATYNLLLAKRRQTQRIGGVAPSTKSSTNSSIVAPHATKGNVPFTNVTPTPPNQAPSSSSHISSATPPLLPLPPPSSVSMSSQRSDSPTSPHVPSSSQASTARPHTAAAPTTTNGSGSSTARASVGPPTPPSVPHSRGKSAGAVRSSGTTNNNIVPSVRAVRTHKHASSEGGAALYTSVPPAPSSAHAHNSRIRPPSTGSASSTSRQSHSSPDISPSSSRSTSPVGNGSSSASVSFASSSPPSSTAAGHPTPPLIPRPPSATQQQSGSSSNGGMSSSGSGSGRPPLPSPRSSSSSNNGAQAPGGPRFRHRVSFKFDPICFLCLASYMSIYRLYCVI